MRSPPSPSTPAPVLQRWIAEAGGVLTVEAFMARALHDPREGYYARRVRDVGPSGDFSTAATLSPALAQAVARWAVAHRGEVIQRGAWHVVELGGGSGRMAADFLAALSWRERRSVRFHLVERAPRLRERQREALAERRWWFGTPAVAWHDSLSAALAAADGGALVFSNEFADAFPCVVLERTANGGWSEVALAWDEAAGGPREILLPADLKALGEASAIGAPFDPGQRVEIHRAFREWLRAEAAPLHRGRMLTIDYGAPDAAALYHRRPRGTLRAYFRQERLVGTDVWQRPGRQDLTADVNFADFIAWTHALGWDALPLRTQAEFLAEWMPPALAADPLAARLADPAGAGGAFQVLDARPSEA